MKCESCEGTKVIEVLYSQVNGSGCGLSNEEAMSKAGEVHHTEECPDCEGHGEYMTVRIKCMVPAYVDTRVTDLESFKEAVDELKWASSYVSEIEEWNWNYNWQKAEGLDYEIIEE